MPVDGDISTDMETTRELAGATTFVPQGVSEAYRSDVYDPKSIVTPPSEVAAVEDIIPGGLADNKSPEDFDQEALQEGIEAELEHTSSKQIAQEIAMDHLIEDQEYYTKLKTIHALKEYFANPSDNLKKLIGNKKYAGTIDNKADLELCVLASDLESAIENVIGDDVSGLVLMDDPEGIESAIDIVLKYEQSNNEVVKTNMDERFYQLSKILAHANVSG